MDVLRVGERGQATVEAAFLIPVLFTVLLLSVQPGMVLYDRMVMQAAVSDACRLVAVKTDAAAVTVVWSYIGELIFNMLILVGSVKMADRIVREMMGL